MTNFSPLDESNTDDKPLSRAQRLATEIKTQKSDSVVNASPENQTSKRAVRPGSRAREMNKRIREVVREQENALYSSEKNAISLDANARNLASQNASAHHENAAPNASSTRLSVASSWEKIADEVAVSQVGRSRGLATGAARGPSVGSAPTEVTTPRWLPNPQAPRAISGESFGREVSLHQALRGQEKISEIHGAHYLVSRAAASYDAAFSSLKTRLNRVLDGEHFAALSGANVEDLLFVDIETTGLSSSVPLFLVGALGLENEAQLDLFLARDLPEERALLAAFNTLAEGKTLITFNGKSFDWPYIEGRSRAHRLPIATPRAHFDLLHHARRHWKHSLPDCKLQTLELFLCGRTRVDDIPGREIPRTYHEFARLHAQNQTGAHLMAPILHHNALDILTMAELLCIMTEKRDG